MAELSYEELLLNQLQKGVDIGLEPFNFIGLRKEDSLNIDAGLHEDEQFSNAMVKKMIHLIH